MKTLLNNTASTVAGVVLFFVGCAMAGLGLIVVALLATFALAAAALAILATPFVGWLQPPVATDAAERETATTA